MKNISFSVLFGVAVVFAANQASAYYSPSTGRWLSRDPNGEPGFETLRMAGVVLGVGQIASSASLPAGRLFKRDPTPGGATGVTSEYCFVKDDSVDGIDPDGRFVWPGPTWPPDPYPVNPHPPSCKEACVLKYVLGIEVDTTVVVSGQPILEKRFVTPGSAEGTSIAGKMTDAILGDAKLPARLPTLTQCCKLTATKSASRFVSRWIPVVGWVMLDYDLSGLAGCMCGCPPD